MARFAWMYLVLVFWAFSPLAKAQDYFSLDDYFRGTGLEGQIRDGQSAPVTANASAPAPVIPNNISAPPRTPQYQALPAQSPVPLSPFSSGGPVPTTPFSNVVLPVNQPTLQVGLTPFSMPSAATSGAMGRPASPALPPPANWSSFPQQQPIPANRPANTLGGHTPLGPIILDGRIEPLDSLSTSPAAVTLANHGSDLDGAESSPMQAGHEEPILTDYGELRADWLKELQNSSDDRYLDDLCISRKGYVVLEHWGYHAAGVAGRGDLLGISTAQASFTLSFPQLIDGFTIRPQVGFHALSGPRRVDMPGNMMDVMVEGGWRQQIGSRAHLRLAATVGSYTDFNQSNLSDSVRVSGLAIGSYEASEDLQYVLGAAYINLHDYPVLPVAGVVYHPHDNLRMDLIFPESKISWRVDPGRDHERWVYFSSSFFGRTWHVQRRSKPSEDVTYSDWRLGLGMESHLQTRAVWYLELGAALGRRLDYESVLDGYSPGPTGYLRGGFYY